MQKENNQKEESKEVISSLKILARSFVIIGLIIVTSKLLSYAYRIVIARYLGPEIYGLFSLAIMVSGWFIAICAFGLSDGLLRYISIFRGQNQVEKIRYIFRKTMIVLSISGVISATVLFLLADFISVGIFHDSSLKIYLQIFSIVIPVSILLGPLLSAMIAYGRVQTQAFLVNVLQNVTKLVFLIMLLFIGYKTTAPAWSHLISLVFVIAAAYLICRYKISGIFIKSKLDDKQKKLVFGEMFSYSWPLLFLGIVTSMFYWIDTFVIGYYIDAAAVGLYNAAVPIALLLSFAQELFTRTFFPLITMQYGRGNKGVINETTKQLGKWVFLMNVPLLIVIMLFPGAIINIFFGAEYLGASTALRFLAVGAFAYSLGSISMSLVSMTGKSKIVLMNFTLISIFNFILCMILVPMYGINGAAFATMLSYIAVSVMFFLQTKHYLNIVPFKRTMLKISLAAIVAAAALVMLRALIDSRSILVLIVITGIFGLVYSALVILTGCLDSNDKIILLTGWNKIFGLAVPIKNGLP